MCIYGKSSKFGQSTEMENAIELSQSDKMMLTLWLLINLNINTYPSLLPEYMQFASILQVTLKTLPENNIPEHSRKRNQAGQKENPQQA